MDHICAINHIVFVIAAARSHNSVDSAASNLGFRCKRFVKNIVGGRERERVFIKIKKNIL